MSKCFYVIDHAKLLLNCILRNWHHLFYIVVNVVYSHLYKVICIIPKNRFVWFLCDSVLLCAWQADEGRRTSSESYRFFLKYSWCFKYFPSNYDITWFSAYLRNHTQSVSFTDALANIKSLAPLPSSIGVFQGSALGPLLFSIFANDLSLLAEDAVIVQYADDTQILVSGNKSAVQKVV